MGNLGLSRWGESVATTALAAIAFIVVTGETLPVGLIGDVARGLDADESTVGLTVSWYAAIAALSAVPLTRWAARFDRRAVLLGSAAVFGVGHLAAAAAQDVAIFAAGRGLAALGHGLYFAVAAPAAVKMARPAMKGRAAARVLVGGSVALVVGTPVATLVGQTTSWRIAMLVVGVLAVTLGLLVARVLPALPGDAAGGVKPPGVLEVLRAPGLLTVMAVVFLLVAGHFTIYTYVAPYVDERFGISGTGLTVLLLAYGVAAVVGSTLGGRLADARPVLGARAVSGLFAAALAVLWLSGLSGFHLVGVPLIIVWGGSFSVMVVSLALATLRRAPGPLAETANALSGIVFQVGIVTGSALGAALVSGGMLAWVPLLSSVLGVSVLSVTLWRGPAFGPTSPEVTDLPTGPQVGLGIPDSYPQGGGPQKP